MKVIKIGAKWCNGCLVMRPRWQEIEAQRPWLKTEYYDFDEDEQQVSVYGIEEGRLPVFIFVDKQGREIKRLQGEVEKQELEELVEAWKDK